MAAELGGTISGGSIEERLGGLYEVAIPAGVAVELDQRMTAAIAGVAAAPPRRPLVRQRRFVAFVLVAAVLATAAAGPLFHWFDGWGESFDRVFELSTPIGQSAVDDGYRLTVVRAYADASMLRLAITAEDLEDRGWSEINAGEPAVRDAAGRDYVGSEGQFYQPSPETSESWLTFIVPPEAALDARQTLTVAFSTIDVRLGTMPTFPNGDSDPESVWTTVSGSWSFTFDVPILATHTIRPGGSAVAGGITVTWDELTVSPASTRAGLIFEDLPPVPADWAWEPEIRIEHDGKPLAIRVLDPGSVTRRVVLEAEPGFAALSGTWVITIDRFHRDVPDPSSEVTTTQESLEGPWVLRFTGPPADGG